MMLVQIPIGREYFFRWAPHHLPTGTPSVTLTANGATQTYNFTVGGTIATINAINSSTRLHSGATAAANLAGRMGDQGGAQWFFYSPGVMAVPVKVSHYDDQTGEYVLAEPLPYSLPANETGSLILNVWHVSIPANALGNTVDRAGTYQIDYVQDLDPNTVNAVQSTHTERGRVRVVRAPFDTGLTAHRLKMYMPQLDDTRPPIFDSWQAVIDEFDPINEIEAALPSSAYADQTLGEQWQRFHALLIGWHLSSVSYLPGVDPDKMRQAADDELARVVNRLHWLDADDDGEVGAGEGAVAGNSLIGLTSTSASVTLAAYNDGRRIRPTLTDADDR
jgi:hypothetical protein